LGVFLRKGGELTKKRRGSKIPRKVDSCGKAERKGGARARVKTVSALHSNVQRKSTKGGGGLQCWRGL